MPTTSSAARNTLVRVLTGLAISVFLWYVDLGVEIFLGPAGRTIGLVNARVFTICDGRGCLLPTLVVELVYIVAFTAVVRATIRRIWGESVAPRRS